MPDHLAATSALLEATFPGAGAGDAAYLRWLYDDSPFGPVVETNLDDDQGRAGHYAIVPVELAAGGAARAGALSLNTAVSERARGGGVFTRLAADTYALAAQRGIEVVVGVANANSTPGFVRRLDFTLVTPLPATVLVPLPGRDGGVRTLAATAHGALEQPGLDALLAPPSSGLTTRWTRERLAWRLARPGRSYLLHHGPGVLAVSALDRRGPVHVAVLLAVFAAQAVPSAVGAAVVRAACRAHRAPLALHVGVNERLSLRGLPLPARLRPSPLNLIYRDLATGGPAPALSRWEFLDFDAY
ncbi:GNAT family N-acetyltransferase [Baekduia soli]|uniref:GNAT family N-acetyltransferase n=1 Tax=Baekduia soli TaxID=496014 RepID=UPI001652AEFF|nr:GNAT family N-acetyltransferase [Baekduia soli]